MFTGPPGVFQIPLKFDPGSTRTPPGFYPGIWGRLEACAGRGLKREVTCVVIVIRDKRYQRRLSHARPQVAKEITVQAITQSKAFDVGAATFKHWKWTPRYTSMWTPSWHGRSVALGFGTKPRKRIIRKGPAWLPERAWSRGAGEEEAQAGGRGEEGP